jgi:hypothetical protein
MEHLIGNKEKDGVPNRKKEKDGVPNRKQEEGWSA